MKNQIWKNIFISMLAVLSICSIYALINEGRNYIGVNYFESGDFTDELHTFQSNLVPLVLAVPDKKEVKEKITVTSAEIEEYRYRYGDLEEQLESIKNQYTETVTTGSEDIKSEETAVEENKEKPNVERDKKIEDITKNFTDDSYVEKKVRVEKEANVDAYFKAIERAKNDFLNENNDFIYNLKNVETGEHFTNGDTPTKSVFKKEFSSNHRYLKERIMYENVEGFWDVQDIIGNPVAKFEGTIAISEASIINGDRGYGYNHFITNQRIFYSLLAVGLLAAFGFSFMWRKNSQNFRYDKAEEMYRKFPIDVKVTMFIMSILLMLFMMDSMVLFIFNADYDMQVSTLIGAVLFTALTLYQWNWLRTDFDQADWKHCLIFRWRKSLEGFFLKQSIGFQTIILLFIVFFWGFGSIMVLLEPINLIVWIPATMFIGIPALVVLLSRMAYLNRVIVKTEEMAKGVLKGEIDVKGKSPIAQHAGNLNALRDRIKSSHSEQAKSERLKTELITNVSHDLRTPLTSIITYTDLLKNPSLTDEERASYVAILDKKSMRLKTLIEDLFDVSKMASGNIELDKRKVDLTQLLQQAIAEHQEEIDKSDLDYRVTIGTKPIMSYVDGQKWWRVLDNLIINTLKYGLPNTRVYIQLDQVDGEAVFVIKNIAKYELGNDVSELTERFKRADTSRNTEGSGLGLAIAQSIVDLHGGSLRMEVDGDLFKVTVKIAAI